MPRSHQQAEKKVWRPFPRGFSRAFIAVYGAIQDIKSDSAEKWQKG